MRFCKMLSTFWLLLNSTVATKPLSTFTSFNHERYY